MSDKYNVAFRARFGDQLADQIEQFDEAWGEEREQLWKCADCGDHVETFILHDELWATIAPPPNEEGRSLLCIYCVENRLGRHLTIDDVRVCKHNDFLLWHFGARRVSGKPINGNVWRFP